VDYLTTLGNLISEIVLESAIHCWPRIVMRSIDHKKFGSGIQPSLINFTIKIQPFDFLGRSSPVLLHQVIDLCVSSFLFPGYERAFNCRI
jgi:hypothetical protein